MKYIDFFYYYFILGKKTLKLKEGLNLTVLAFGLLKLSSHLPVCNFRINETKIFLSTFKILKQLNSKHRNNYYTH